MTDENEGGLNKAHARIAEAFSREGVNALSEISKLTSPLADYVAQTQAQEKFLRGMIPPAVEAMRLLDQQSTSVFKKLHEQEKNIGLFNVPSIPFQEPEISRFTIPKNPILETNDRLANIEERFARMEAIAIDSAAIATSIQKSAIDFLVKFEAVAADNDKSVKKTILMGKVAIFVALLTAIIPIAYSEWKAAKNAAETQTLISDMNKEINGLKDVQREESNHLSQELLKSNNAVVDVLGKIKDILSKKRIKGGENTAKK